MTIAIWVLSKGSLILGANSEEGSGYGGGLPKGRSGPVRRQRR
jgi:hypothetical protein